MSRSVIVDHPDEIRILHVDDDVNQSEFLQYFLPEMDKAFRIDFVCDPCQVMEKLKSERYDCVVTDYQMPKINGIELAEKIRESFDLPIIIYTGQGSEEIAEAAFSAGIDDYLRKEMDPSHYQVLAKRIRNVVEKKRIDIMYKTMIEGAKEAIIISVDDRIEFANKATLDLLGINNVSEWEADQFSLLKRLEENNKLLSGSEMLSENDHIQSVYTLNLKKGRKIIVESSSSALSYNGKNGVITFLRDITEKEKLEEEKRESQERFRSLFELAPDGILTVSLTGMVTAINPAFTRLTGYPADEFVGKHFLSMKTLPKTDLRYMLSVFINMLKGNTTPPPFEFRYIRRDGTKSWGECHCALINISGKKELLAIARDVGDRKRVDKKEKSEELLRETSSTGVDNDLLISVGQLGYLLSEQVLSNVKDADEKMKYYFSNAEKYDESIQEVNDILSQTLVLLKEYKRISDDTILKPNENIMNIITKIIEPISKPIDLNVNITLTGEQILASFDVEIIDKVLTMLFKEITNFADNISDVDVSVNIKDKYLEIEIKNFYDSDKENVSQKLIHKISENPEINIMQEYIHDYNGDLRFSRESSSIIIKIPTYEREIQGKEILNKIINTSNLKQLL